jgi:hypothetical protein
VFVLVEDAHGGGGAQQPVKIVRPRADLGGQILGGPGFSIDPVGDT